MRRSTVPGDNQEPLPDLSLCAQEPIHTPGSIEPGGVLLVLQEPSLSILQVSSNSGDLLGSEAPALLGTPLASLLDPPSLASLTRTLETENIAGKRRYAGDIRLGRGAHVFDALVHRHQGLLYLELEPAPAVPDPDCCRDFSASLTDAVTDLAGPASLPELCRRVVSRVRRLTGFDRVMVYRFLPDDSGSVIAEDRREDLTPYLGLRYPASDIPPQARRLYLWNTIRLKADVNALPVPMVPPVNPLTGQPLDMSHCILRAMSPVHVEYLRNMGVTATMSISIIRNEQLWGLIACHHTSPRKVPHSLRISCEVLARVFSSHLTAAEESDRRMAALASRRLREEIADRLTAPSDVRHVLSSEGRRLVAAANATGAAVCIGDTVDLLGTTPSRELLLPLLGWLKSSQQRYVFATDNLSAAFPLAAAFHDIASGLLSARIALAGSDFVLWFRPAALQVIHWAGNPEKPVHETEAGKRLSPRLSFERWSETLGGHSEAWLEHEVEFALLLRQSVAEALLVQHNQEISRLNLELERSNVELDAFAYAAGHDLQEPVRTIRAYSQLLRRNGLEKLDEDMRGFLKIIEDGAGRMGRLISALLAYGQVGGQAVRKLQPVRLEDVLQWAQTNLDDAIRSAPASITHDPLPLVTGDPEQLLQLLQNLISNSIKYRRPDVPLEVHVSAVEQERSWLIGVRDNGAGFDPEDADLIFGAFKRLHGSDIPGTGIGLALCKRIVDHHGGRIWGESLGKGQGAAFYFTLPAANA